jgi:hypothetical protein
MGLNEYNGPYSLGKTPTLIPPLVKFPFEVDGIVPITTMFIMIQT